MCDRNVYTLKPGTKVGHIVGTKSVCGNNTQFSFLEFVFNAHI